jgi:hypothetical protein
LIRCIENKSVIRICEPAPPAARSVAVMSTLFLGTLQSVNGALHPDRVTWRLP